MLVHTILEALGPITLGIAVGWGCGKTGFVKQDYSQAFADYVVKIALPLALFLAALSSSPKNILNVDYALALAVGLIVTYVLGYIAGRVMFKHNKADATMQALAVSFPDMAYCGPPVLIAAVGSSGLIAMVIGNLIYTVLILPLALAFFVRWWCRLKPCKSIRQSRITTTSNTAYFGCCTRRMRRTTT